MCAAPKRHAAKRYMFAPAVLEAGGEGPLESQPGVIVINAFLRELTTVVQFKLVVIRQLTTRSPRLVLV